VTIGLGVDHGAGHRERLVHDDAVLRWQKEPIVSYTVRVNGTAVENRFQDIEPERLGERL
jgi:hypothetical protein